MCKGLKGFNLSAALGARHRFVVGFDVLLVAGTGNSLVAEGADGDVPLTVDGMDGEVAGRHLPLAVRQRESGKMLNIDCGSNNGMFGTVAADGMGHRE